MKKFNLIINTLFIMFSTNYSIGMDINPEKNSASSNLKATNIRYWSNTDDRKKFRIQYMAAMKISNTKLKNNQFALIN